MNVDKEVPKAKAAGHGSKRHRSRREQAAKPPCYISHLPVEILAEILGYVRIQDILAMARASKYYCAALVTNPASMYIWKEARARFTPKPIPDPTPNFTEPSYAAFLFDEGICEVCRTRTKGPFVSYSLRLHLCKRHSCRTTWRGREKKLLDTYNCTANEIATAEPLMQLEDNSTFLPTADYATIGLNAPVYRLSDWLHEVDARNRVQVLPLTETEYLQKREVRIKIKKSTMELSEQLIEWRQQYDQEACSIKEQNLKLIGKIASSLGQKPGDLHHCPSCALLYRSKTSSLETLTNEDFLRIQPLVNRELDALYTERERRITVKNVEDQQEAVLELYERLKSRPAAIVPPLKTFRKLPVVRRMAGSSTSSDISNEIRDSTLIARLAEGDVQNWVKDAKDALTTVLGFAPLNESHPTSLAPVNRLTARFRCKKCDSKQSSWPSDRSLSFAEACAHQCMHTRNRPSGQKVWNAEQFVPDYKAIDVVQQVLMWCGYTADDALSLEMPEEVGTRIQCLSCPSHIVMTYDNLFSHCYRHESMQLKLLSVQEVSEILQYPIKVGRCAQLTKHTGKSQAERQRPMYGCRHCEQKIPIPSESVATTKADVHMVDASPQLNNTTIGPERSQDGTRGSLGEAAESKNTKSKSPQLFKFDGLRSHAKEK
ncbi:hypothetical protein BDY19DRAFT_939752 [Irpex rosettiformis]|uniref:Uncharacterized protein n=1 Tax=Irpex rosettiformis TaxID=378272 RepID=A0ACB8U7I9_9APHY|nr:hypothetical protein BDY19DRAFT_939752 [Irpex rosettiformis]